MFKNDSRSFQLIRLQFEPYTFLIIILVMVMWVKIVLEALLPLLLVPVFYEFGGELMNPDDSSQLESINQWMEAIQHYFGFSSKIETTFYAALFVVVPKAILTIIFQYLQNHVMYDYEHQKRKLLFSKLLRVNWMFFLNQKSGHIINTLHTETNRGAQVFSGLVMLLDTLFLVGINLLLAAYVSWVSTLFALGAFVFLTFVLIPAAKYAKGYGQYAVSSRETLMHHLNQLVQSFKILKGSRMEAAAQNFITDASERCRYFYVRMGVIKILPGAIFEPVIIVAVFGLLLAASEYRFVSLAEAGVVAVIIYRSFNKSANLHKFWINFYEYLPSLRLMHSLPQLYEENAEERPAGKIKQVDRIEFQGVHYQYPARDERALSGVDMCVKQGEFIGIVGTSGSGKTTLVDNLLYLLKPTDGRILLNDEDLSTIDPWQWRELIGYVPQESILLNDSVRNNITLYRENIRQEDIEWAVDVANAEEFIRDLPDGYDTVVGERGAKLSGGQRQRLVLARALVHKPQLLLLDEATSALDSFTETKIKESVDRLKGQFTILAVAHRLSTVINADRIIVLDEGKVVQCDSPSVLISHQGKFQELYQQQFHAHEN